MCGRRGMAIRANEVNYGVLEWVKRNMLTWFRHVMKSEEFVNSLCEQEFGSKQ